MPRYRCNMMDDRRNPNYASRNTQNNCGSVTDGRSIPSDCGCMANERNMQSDCGCMINERNMQSDRGRMTNERNMRSNCGCMVNNGDSMKMVLAMAYVPWQRWENLYDLNQALMSGTIFADLNKPFKGSGGCCNGR